ncbi:MAG: hypothetical protein ACYC1U_01845 [Candidatus Aquicultorales bacterium]
MTNALIIYLLLVSLGLYLIVRFFIQKSILNLMLGIGVILAPGFITAAKLIYMGEALPGIAKGGIAVVATAIFGFFTYVSGFASIGVRRQLQDPKYRPSPVDMGAYLLSVVLLITFAVTVLD